MIFLFVISSCVKKEADTGDYSAQFKIIFTNVTRLYDQKKPDEGLRYLNSAFRHIKKPYTSDIFRMHGFKYIYQKRVSHNNIKALLYADSMLIAAKKSVNPKQYVSNYAEANFAKGDAYYTLRQYNNAYQCYYQGYYMGKNNLKDEILAEYTYRMGMVMYNQAHFNEAANYFKESFRQSVAYKTGYVAFFQRQELLDNVGESYKSNGDLDSATAYFNKALNYINNNTQNYKNEAPSLEIARAVVYGNQGEVAMLKGQYQQANILLSKSIAINSKKGNDNFNAELVKVNLAKLYLDHYQYKLFMDLASGLRHQLDSVKNEDAETRWNLLMSKYYKENGDMAKAFTHLENYNILKDSIIKRASSLKEMDITQQQANYDKQSQILTLKGNNKLQIIYTYLAVISVAMAVIIIVLVLRNWKKSKEDIQIVNKLNKQISFQKNDLEITLAELKLSSQEKDRILHAVAHDLRNPLGGIASLTDVMSEEDFTDDQRSMINLIKETSYNSLELINEILEATANSSRVLHKELVEINALVANSVELLRFKAAEKAQHIEVELLNAPQDILISREKIWRVINNLIVNAIKFSPADTTILIKLTNNADNIEVCVQDNGIGIPNNLKQKVFNTFTDARRLGTAGEKSFGLGLSICKQIVELHSGKIWFESEGKGTIFHFTLAKEVTAPLKTRKKITVPVAG